MPKDLKEMRQRLKELLLKKSYREGRIKLTSGRESDFYIDGKQTTLDAEGAYLCGVLLHDLISSQEEKIGGVEAATPFNDVPGLLRSRSSISPAKIMGIDPATAGRVIETLKDVSLPDNSNLKSVDDNFSALPGIVLAKELAGSLRVMEGDIISLISPGWNQGP